MSLTCRRCTQGPGDCACTPAQLHRYDDSLLGGLFGKARADDPSTSHEAAIRSTNDGTVPEAARLALNLVRKFPRWTGQEYALEEGGGDSRKVGRRLSELEKAGLIRRCSKRACRISGYAATTWEAVP